MMFSLLYFIYYVQIVQCEHRPCNYTVNNAYDLDSLFLDDALCQRWPNLCEHRLILDYLALKYSNYGQRFTTNSERSRIWAINQELLDSVQHELTRKYKDYWITPNYVSTSDLECPLNEALTASEIISNHVETSTKVTDFKRVVDWCANCTTRVPTSMSLDLGCMNSMRLLLIRATNDQNTDAKQYVDNFENSLKQIHGNDVIIIRLKPALTVTNAALQLEEPYYRFVDAFESIYHMLSRTRNDKCQLENINEKNFVVLLIADGDDINLDSTINYSRQILSCHNTIYTIPIDRNVDICQLSKIATSPGTSFGYVGVDLLTDLSLPLVNIIQREHMVIKQNQQNFTLCNNVQRVVIHAGKTSNIPLIIQIKVSVPTNLYFGHFKYPSASRYEYKFSAIKSKPLTLLIQAIDDVYVTVSSKQISSTTPSWIDILNFKSCPPFHYGDNCRKMCYVSGYISHIVPCLDSSKSMYQSRNENTKSHRIYSDHSFVSSPTSFNQPARYSSHHENREIAKMLHPTGRQFPKTSNNRQNVVNQAEENKIVDDGLSHHTNRKHRFSATQSYIKSTIQSPTNSSVVDQSLRRFQSVSKTNRNNALVETNTVDDRHYLNHQIDDEYNNYYIEKPSNDKIKIVDFNTFADNTIIDDVDIVFNSIQASSTEQHLQPVVPSKNKSVFYNRLGSRPPVDYSNHQNASSCPYGTWNIPSCTGRCNCDNKISCDVITGRCPGKCLKGWMSSNLDLNRCDLPECNYKIENADENVELEYMLDPHFCNVFYCCGLNGTSNAIMLTCPKNMMFDRDGRCVKGVDANSSTTESCLQKDIPSKDDFECPQSLKSIKRQHFNARISMLMSHGLLPRHNESMASWLKSNGYMMSVHDPNHCDIYHQCIYDDNQNLIYSNVRYCPTYTLFNNQWGVCVNQSMIYRFPSTHPIMKRNCDRITIM